MGLFSEPTGRGVFSRAVLAAALLTVGGAASASASATRSSGNGQLVGCRALVARLATASWRARRQAQLDLMRQSPARLAAVLHDLSPAASPEVRRRLIRVAVHLRFKGQTSLSGRSPLLGIMMRMVPLPALPTPLETKNNGGPHAAVLVLQVQPGFPAAQALQNGDLITAVNGQAFGPSATVLTFRRMVTSLSPGTMMRFSVVRGTRLLHVVVPLAAVPVREAAVTVYMQKRISRAAALADGLWRLGEKPLIVAPRALDAAQVGPAAYAPARRSARDIIAVACRR